MTFIKLIAIHAVSQPRPPKHVSCCASIRMLIIWKYVVCSSIAGMAESEGKSRVRKRKDTSKTKDRPVDDGIKSSGSDGSPTPEKSEKDDSCKGEKKNAPSCQVMEAGSYWLTRIVFTRAIGFIYCMY